MEQGYIKLHRKFFEDDMWSQKRTYSQAEAWIDLIQMARYEAEPYNKLCSNGRKITINRGEIHASLRYLGERWKWSKDRVARWLKGVENVRQRTIHGETIITLCKYEDYNILPYICETPKETAARQRRDSGETNKKKDKKEKNNIDNKLIDYNLPYQEINVIGEIMEISQLDKKEKLEISDRKEIFKKELAEFLPEYGRDMLNEFYIHWTERNRGGRKMKFEMEKTWELSLRLKKWKANENKFSRQPQTYKTASYAERQSDTDFE